MDKSRRVDVRLPIYALENYRMASGEPLAIGGLFASLVGAAKADRPLSTLGGRQRFHSEIV